MDDLNCFQLAGRAAEFGHEPLVDGVQVTLEEGVVGGRVVLVVAVGRELGVMAVAFAHEDVDLARLQYPIEAGQLAEVDLERVRATFLALLAAIARLATFLAVVLAQQDVFGLRCKSLLCGHVALVAAAAGRAALLRYRRLFTDMAFDSAGIFVVVAGPDG